MSHKDDYERLNRRVSQGNRRRKEADAEVRAEAAERDTAVLRSAKAYTDERADEIWQAVRDLQHEEKIERDYEERCAPRFRVV